MERIASYFLREIELQHLIGVSYVVCRKGKEIFRGNFGFADVARTNNLQGNEIFRLASMTKPITAVAVLKAVEKGMLDLDEPIGTYIKGFHHGGVGKVEKGQAIFSHSAREITLRDILCHTSGLGHNGKVGAFEDEKHNFDKPCQLKENVENWNGALLDFAPGEIHNGYGGTVPFELAAYAVEYVSEQPFDNFLKQEIFQPLGMKDTTYSLTEEQKLRVVEVCQEKVRGKLEKLDLGWAGFHSYAEGYTGGSAGLFSTLDDYLSFANMLLYGNGILKQESLIEMRRPQYPQEGNMQQWGLGVRVCTQVRGWQTLPIGSFGWSGYYGTHFWCEPQTGTVAVLMFNKDAEGAGSRFIRDFERLVQIELRNIISF